MIKRVCSCWLVIFLFISLMGSVNNGAFANMGYIRYIDDLYDLAVTTLKISVTKGDDFVRLIKTTNKVDDLFLILSKMPKFKKLDTVLDVAALRGHIKPIEILKIKGITKHVKDADVFLLQAFQKGDDLVKVANVLAQRYNPAFWGKLGESASSSILRANLIRIGRKVPSFSNAAHHIVAGSDNAAALSRQILTKYGIGINGAANGVFLPINAAKTTAVIHKGSHKLAYHRWVYEQLQNAKSKEELVDILEKIGQKLATGNVPIGVW